jgi:hypothetical protein
MTNHGVLVIAIVSLNFLYVEQTCESFDLVHFLEGPTLGD